MASVLERERVEEYTVENWFEALLEDSFNYAPPKRGEIREGTLLEVGEKEILVDIGAKRDGLVTINDLSRMDDDVRQSLAVGQVLPVYIINEGDENDNLIVSINLGWQQQDWQLAQQLLESGELVEVEVTDYNRGGILVNWKRLEGFVPNSHLVSFNLEHEAAKDEAFEEHVSQTLGVKVIEVDPQRRRLVFSEREAQREWRSQQKARLMSDLAVGNVVTGTVTGIRDFGAFVDLGGADGLVHVSELAWHRVDHPSDVLAVGDEVEVYITELDHDRNRISLSRKQLLPDPWDEVTQNHYEGQEVEGLVTNVVDFGVFMVLDSGIEGLLHLSEIGDGTLEEPFSYVKKGDRLTVRISHLDLDRKRVGFTQRWGIDEEEVIQPTEPPKAESEDANQTATFYEAA